MTNTYTGIRSFMKTSVGPVGHKPISTVGVCYDLGTSNRPGARLGPTAIRDASAMLCDGRNPYTDMSYDDILKNVGDIGDVEIDRVVPIAMLESDFTKLVDKTKLISMGGDHTITYPILKAHYKKYGKMSLVHFDAHIDAWDEGKTPNHGNFLRLAIEDGLVDPERIVQIGIRSSSPKSNNDWLIDRGIIQYNASTVHKMNLDDLADDIIQSTDGLPTYMTFDIDCLDASQAPGTGTPEVGGLFTWQIMEIMKQLHSKNKKLIGADLVEVCPAYDVSQITALAGATIMWNMISLMDVK